jgi:hypothetical protein
MAIVLRKLGQVKAARRGGRMLKLFPSTELRTGKTFDRFRLREEKERVRVHFCERTELLVGLIGSIGWLG